MTRELTLVYWCGEEKWIGQKRKKRKDQSDSLFVHIPLNRMLHQLTRTAQR